MQDKHDPRDFDQYLVLNLDGSVAATKMIAITPTAMAPTDSDTHVHMLVTGYGPADFDRVQVAPEVVTALIAASLKDIPSAFAGLAVAVDRSIREHRR